MGFEVGRGGVVCGEVRYGQVWFIWKIKTKENEDE